MTFFYDLNKRLAGLTGKTKLAEDGSWGMAEDSKTTKADYDKELTKGEIDIDRLKQLAHNFRDEKSKEEKSNAFESSGDDKFIDYVFSFYGKDGIYDMNVSRDDIAKAVAHYKKQPDTDFAADSFDREHIRDILIDKFGYEWVNEAEEVADKDYDGDGKIESSKDEVWGSRAKAAAKAGTPFNEADVMSLEEGADEAAVRELVLFADNDHNLYRQSYEPIIKNLQRKVTKGIYDVELAKKLWTYHAERAAKSYAEQHGDGRPWNRLFSPEDRRAAAAEFEKNAREEIGAEEIAEEAQSKTDDALRAWQEKQREEKMKRLSNPRDYFETALDTCEEETEDDEDIMSYLNRKLAKHDAEQDRRVSESKSAKKKTEKEDQKAEKAGKKVAKDIEYDEKHKGKDDDKAERAGKKVTKDIEYDDKKDKKETSKKVKDAIKKVVIPAQRDEVEKYQATGRIDPKKFKKEFVNKEMKKIDEQLSYMGEDEATYTVWVGGSPEAEGVSHSEALAVAKEWKADGYDDVSVEKDEAVKENAQARQYNGKGHNNAQPGIEFEDTTSSSGGTIASKAGVTKHTAGDRYAAQAQPFDDGDDDKPRAKAKKVPSGLGRGRPAKEKAPEYTKMNDPFGRVSSTIPKGKKGTVHKIADPDMDEAMWETKSYSAKKAAAGKDIGKPGKNFDKIAKSAGEKYGSAEAGKRVAGAVLNKLRAKTSESAKPDFLDMDKDGNKSEPMKKAVADKQKSKKLDELSPKTLRRYADKALDQVTSSGDSEDPATVKQASKRLAGYNNAVKKAATSKELDEKAVSKKQQKFMGMVHAAQQGEKPASGAVAKVAKSMGKQDVKDFAATKHKGLPEKVKEEDRDNVMDIPNTAGAAHTQTKPGSNKDGIVFAAGIYEQFDAELEQLISLNESVDITMARHDQNGAEQDGAVVIQADGVEADLIKDLLRNAGLINYENDLISQQNTQNVDAVADANTAGPAPLDIKQFCPVCDCIPCGCGNQEAEVEFELEEGSMKDAMWRDAERMERAQFCEKYGEEHGEFWDNICGDLAETDDDFTSRDVTPKRSSEEWLPGETDSDDFGPDDVIDEADAPVTDNEPDWPTNQETSDDALQYSGGLNKPKSTGQTTIPVIASQLNRQHSMEENIDLERSLFKTWKNYTGE